MKKFVARNWELARQVRNLQGSPLGREGWALSIGEIAFLQVFNELNQVQAGYLE